MAKGENSRKSQAEDSLSLAVLASKLTELHGQHFVSRKEEINQLPSPSLNTSERSRKYRPMIARGLWDDMGFSPALFSPL